MKQLYELDEKVSKDDLPDIYWDMDMVLCDFMKGADKAVGEPFIYADRETRWKKISNTNFFCFTIITNIIFMVVCLIFIS